MADEQVLDGREDVRLDAGAQADQSLVGVHLGDRETADLNGESTGRSGTVQLPAPPATTTLAWNPPAQFGTPQQIASGKAHFGRYCIVCHGDSAIGNGFTPDLRVSGTLANADAWKSVIIDGALKDRGMVSFAPVMSAAEAESIRAYVIKRAHDTYEATSAAMGK